MIPRISSKAVGLDLAPGTKMAPWIHPDGVACTEEHGRNRRRNIRRGTSAPRGMERDAYRLCRAILHGFIATQSQRNYCYERQGRVRHKQRRKPKCCRLTQPPRRLILLVGDQPSVRGISCNFCTVVAYTKLRSSQERPRKLRNPSASKLG